MKKVLLLVLMCSLASFYATAQSKVFKEVSEDISTQVVSIRQEDELVGYLVFTQLEKVSEDSFKYRVTLLDENLNDLNNYDFSDQRLFLKGVALDQDVLCIAYVRSEVIGREFDDIKDYKSYIKDHSTNSDIILQFLNIDGKLLKKTVIPLELNFSTKKVDEGRKLKIVVVSSMKEEIQLKNIPQQGFVLFYGDDFRNVLTVYKPDGSMGWQKVIKEDKTGYVILTSKQAVYLLMMKLGLQRQMEYDLACYHVKDSISYPRYQVRGTYGNSLEAISFKNDPTTGFPSLSGFIADRKQGSPSVAFKGLFTYNFKGTTEAEPQVITSYWAFAKQANIPLEGRRAVSYATYSFKDYEGNTYFAGMSFIEDTKKGNMQPSQLIKLDTSGVLFLEATIPNSKNAEAIHPSYRSYAAVYDKSASSCYFICSDSKAHNVYDIKGKKISRSIPVSNSGSQISISPAKDGYMMVVEYNKKEKYTRISIEQI